MSRPLPGWLRLALAGAPLLLLLPQARHAIESRMALHMLVEFPLLFASGAACRQGWRRPAALLAADWLGLAGLVFGSCVFAFWMIPAALDAALLSPVVAGCKLACWWLAGLAVANSLRRTRLELLLFFVGNAVWMAATAGLLYLDAEDRLCVNYLLGDQAAAGKGLLLLSFLLLLYGVSLLCADDNPHAEDERRGAVA